MSEPTYETEAAQMPKKQYPRLQNKKEMQILGALQQAKIRAFQNNLIK